MNNMLPPSMFPEEDGDGHYTEFDPEIWADQAEADSALNLIEHWNDGNGFNDLEWMDMIIDVWNIQYDEDGNITSFDFEWESADGDYGGVGHAH